jgi:FkbM family methyltransferase
MEKTNYFDKVKQWDDQHCEKHVWNLVNNIKELLTSKNINELYYIDIGANVGKVYDLLNTNNLVKKVWMYEASPILYDYLKIKYNENNDVVIKNVAISDNEGDVNFDESSIIYQVNNNATDLNFGLSKITDSLTQTKVKCNKISNLVLNDDEILSNVTFIKIDTENMDFNILNDIVNIIDKFRIKPIIEFEVNYHMGPITKEMAQSILDKFESFGYKKLKLDDCWGDGILIPE